MTEDEAKTKWCPYARVTAVMDDVVLTGGNRMVSVGDGLNLTALKPEASACLGSECMAWRWGWDQKPDWKPAATPEEYLQRDTDANIGFVRSQTSGFCGLAGKP